jgi:hypothetical protein
VYTHREAIFVTPCTGKRSAPASGTFIADNVAAAKDIMLTRFRSAHNGGHPVTLNSRKKWVYTTVSIITLLAYTTITIITLTPSRPGYVYAACKKCTVKAAVSQETGNIWKWSIPVSPSECGSLSLAPSHTAIVAPTAAPAPSHTAIVAPTAAPQQYCWGCAADYSANEGCACESGNFFCDDCFSSMVISQVTGVDKAEFLTNGCVITCTTCKAAGRRTVFDMRLCSPHLSQGAYLAHLSAMAEPEVAREQKEWQQRLDEARRQGGGAAAVDECAEFVDDMAERLVATTCPCCGRHIPEFDACAALQCGRHAGSIAVSAATGCGAHLCAWCLHVADDADACHKHVLTCCKNPSPGTQYSKP